jgi:phenylpyruvate tautomerase PptA (4-oxalocrotonate tautomerase family)/YHS domain-containing protein
MFLIEVFVPPGTASLQRRAELAAHLGEVVVTEEHAAAETVAAAQDATDVIVHEPAAWFVCREPLGPDGPARFLVRVTVPGAWRRELSEHFVSRITPVLADPDDGGPPPKVVVQVVGVPERGYGLDGQVFGSNALAELMSTPYREARRSGTAAQPPPGKVVDPSCGAILSLDTTEAVMHEIDGAGYGFCCTHCRDAFVAETAGNAS